MEALPSRASRGTLYFNKLRGLSLLSNLKAFITGLMSLNPINAAVNPIPIPIIRLRSLLFGLSTRSLNLSGWNSI